LDLLEIGASVFFSNILLNWGFVKNSLVRDIQGVFELASFNLKIPLIFDSKTGHFKIFVYHKLFPQP
jgi:hypothetical protein